MAKPDGFDHSMYTAVKSGEKTAVEFYNRWIEEVKMNVPNDRLLIHKSIDGWEPLCKFLDLPVPDEPYPRINDKESVKERIDGFKRLNQLIFVVAPLTISVVAAVIYYKLK